MRSLAIFVAVCGLALCLSSAPSSAQTQPPIQEPVSQTPPHSFSAQWITAANAPGHDPAVLRL